MRPCLTGLPILSLLQGVWTCFSWAFSWSVALGGSFGHRAPAWSEVASAGSAAELRVLLVVPFSPETAINRQKSIGKTSHDKNAPSQQMEAAVMPDLARCSIMYVRKGSVPCWCQWPLLWCAIQEHQGTQGLSKLSCLDVLWQTWSDLCRAVTHLTASWWQQPEGASFLVFLGLFWAGPRG